MADQRTRKTTTPELEELRSAQAAKKRPAADPTNVLDKAIYQLWETINDLDQIQPERVEHYRVSIFGSSRIRRGDPIYDEVKKLSADLARMGVDIVTGGGPGLMEGANAGAVEGQIARPMIPLTAWTRYALTQPQQFRCFESGCRWVAAICSSPRPLRTPRSSYSRSSQSTRRSQARNSC